MDKKLLNLHLYTNRNCNLHCNHCYNNSFYQKGQKEIQIEQLVHLMKAFYNAYDVDIHLEGGEIFLRPEVFEALALLDEQILSHITITSNGSIYDDRKEVNYVLKHIQSFRISIEGHTNELNRKLRDIDVETILENATKYQKMGANVILRTTLHKENLQILFKETIPFIVDRGFHKLQVYELQAVGRGEKLKGMLIGDDEFEAFLSSLAKEKPADMNVKLMFSPCRVKAIEEKEKELTKAGYHITQMLPARSLSVSTEGNVSICPWGSDEHILFNINEENEEKDVCTTLEKYDLVHECEHCSKIKLEVG